MPFDGFSDARPPISVGNRAPSGWWRRLAVWRENRALRQQLVRCQALDPRFARDIGLSPEAIAMEAERPFWIAVGRMQP